MLGSLEPLLHGRVGRALDSVEGELALADAKRRIAAQKPPGHKDAGKDEARAAGDCPVWTQPLVEASSRGCDAGFSCSSPPTSW